MNPTDDQSMNNDVTGGDPVSPLPQDQNTPFSPPDDQPSTLPVDHPVTDTNSDPDEAYQEGVDAAVGLPQTPPTPTSDETEADLNGPTPPPDTA